MNKEMIPFLNQLVKSLEEATIKLEQAYDKNDYEMAEKLKKFILEIQKRMSEILK